MARLVGTATLETGAMLDKMGRPVVPAMELMTELAGAGTPREVRLGRLELPRMGIVAGLADARERTAAMRVVNLDCIVAWPIVCVVSKFGWWILSNTS